MINEVVLILGLAGAERAVEFFQGVGFGKAFRGTRLNVGFQGFTENAKEKSAILHNGPKWEKREDDAVCNLPQHSHKAVVLTCELLLSTPTLFPVSFRHSMTP